MRKILILIYSALLVLALPVTSFAYADKDVSQTFYGTSKNQNDLDISPSRDDYGIQAHNFYGTINFYATQGYPVRVTVYGNHGDGTSYQNLIYIDGKSSEESFSSNNDHNGSGWAFVECEMRQTKTSWSGTCWAYLAKNYTGSKYTVRFARTPTATYKNYIKDKIDFNAVKAASPVRVTINVRQNPQTTFIENEVFI